MTIINTSPDRIIQLGYEGEDRVTVLRFRYSADWLENGEGIFTVRVLRNGENQAYNAQVIKDDRENLIIDMTVTDVELSKMGYGEMQLVYTGADFVKKSPVYKYYVSRSVDEAVDPPESDVYTQIIESLSDLRTNFNELTNTISEINGDIGDLSELTTTAKTDLVSAINEVNTKGGGGGGSVTVDDALSTTSTNPVQNKVVTSAVQGKADIQTVSALADAVNGLDSDVQGLQTGKADTATVTALSGTVSGLQTAVQSKAEAQTVTALSGTVTGLQTSKADKSYVDTQLSTKASAQTVSDLSGNVSDLQTGLASKVSDVQINGSSIVSDGVANVPIASTDTLGVVRVLGDRGITFDGGKRLQLQTAGPNATKNGTASFYANVPEYQHASTFYGLAKVAGHDEKDSTLPLGTYSEEAKTAIRTMLGLQEMYEWYKNQTQGD